MIAMKQMKQGIQVHVRFESVEDRVSASLLSYGFLYLELMLEPLHCYGTKIARHIF